MTARQSLFPTLIYLGLAVGILTGCRGGAEASVAADTPGDAGDDPRPGSVRVPAQAPQVAPGAEVLVRDSLHLVRGRRVGLVTNHTGIVAGYPVGAPRELGSTIDLLHEHPEVELVALFGPEHGLQGRAGAGEAVGDARDELTGVPIHSLYGPGEGRKPTPEMLRDVEVLLFDIQDVGARYYTYIYTMALAMEAAGEAGIPFVVLDRPNPIGGERVQGNVLDPEFATFVGMYPIPMRHGMTPGELAGLFRGEFGVEADLHVVPADGWRRDMTFEETGLPWVPPSPNMPNTVSAQHYPGTCLFEGTNLSVGRGTERPFQQVGAPWLDGAALAERLNDRGIPGVRFEPVSFRPEQPGDGKFSGELVHGVRFEATGPIYDPTRAAVAVLVEARAMSGAQWEWLATHFDRLAGTDALRAGIDAGRDLPGLTAAWPAQLEAFGELRNRYLIYR